MAVNPRNWILATPEIGDASTITASHALAECPVTNLQKIQPTDVWASSNLTPYIEADLGSSDAKWNLFGLFFHNGDGRNSFRVRAASTQATLTSSPSYDSGYGSLRCASSTVYGEHSNASFAVAPPLFFEARLRPKTVGVASSVATLKNTSTSNVLSLMLGADGSGIALGTGADINIGAYSGSSKVKEWIHLGVAIEATSATLYIDGIPVASDTHATSFAHNQIWVNHNGSSGGGMAADYDWCRLWSGARTAEQIFDNHATEISGAQAGLLANYTFKNTGANAGSVGGSMNLYGSYGYAYEARAWASKNLASYDRKHGMLWVPAGVTARWLRVDFDWDDNAESLLKLGRLYVANAHQFERNPEYGADIWSFEDGARHDTLHGGQRIISPSTPVPGFRLPFTFDSAEEMAVFYDVVRTRGASRDVAIILDPIDHDGRRHQRIGYGTLSQRVVANLPAYEQYKSQVELRGLI